MSTPRPHPALVVYLVLGFGLSAAACGGGGGGGDGGTSCTAGQACTGADPCKTHLTACAGPGATATCEPSGDAADGTSCGDGRVCAAGVCPTNRTVSGIFLTAYTPESGVTTVLPGPPPRQGPGPLENGFFLPDAGPGRQSTLLGLLVPDGSPTGYTELPASLSAAGDFSVPDVPPGPYFLSVEERVIALTYVGTRVEGRAWRLWELTRSTPDLTYTTSERPDLTFPTSATTATFSLSGLDPWVGLEDRLYFYGGQVPTQRIDPPPADGDTAVTRDVPWTSGLLDASKGDVLYVAQRVTEPISGKTGTVPYLVTRKVARVADVTLADGAGGTVTAALAAPTTLGSARADYRGSELAALTAAVHPAATLPQAWLSVRATPGSLSFPHTPSITIPLGVLVLDARASADDDYGTISYGRFLDPAWQEMRELQGVYHVWLTPPGATTERSSLGFVTSRIPLSSAPVAAAPVLGPPLALQVNGLDATVARTGVGLQPVLSWSPPALGLATSYVVTVGCGPTTPAANDLAVLSAHVRGTSFRVPPGCLQAGAVYQATVTTRQAPWDETEHGPYQVGLPLHEAEALTAWFAP